MFLDGQLVGVTPATVHCPRQSRGGLRLELEGYEIALVQIESSLNGWVFGNIVFGGLIGVLVDLIASNFYKHSTTPINIVLRVKKPAS